MNFSSDESFAIAESAIPLPGYIAIHMNTSIPGLALISEAEIFSGS